MYTIPLIDIRNSSPVQLVRTHAEQARALIAASRDTLGLVSRLISYFVLPLSDSLSNDWLERTNNPYRHEIEMFVEILDVSGLYTLNLCYEWGCTSGVYRKDQNLVLARVLDWPFPAMGENIIVTHQSGKAGDFFNVTWPGASGVFSAMAPGRFAVALNQAPMRRHNMNFVFDWAKNRLDMRYATGLPPGHLLRKVFETASSYQEASQMLATEEVALPVIFIVSGIKNDEGCVIERTERNCAIRELNSDRVCAANHFETRLKDTGHGWRPRRADSADRIRMATSLPVEAINENFDWFKSPIANSFSRLVMLADAATGRLSVMGTFGEKRVTERFTVSSEHL